MEKYTEIKEGWTLSEFPAENISTPNKKNKSHVAGLNILFWTFPELLYNTNIFQDLEIIIFVSNPG